jgi:hypothetical protein
VQATFTDGLGHAEGPLTSAPTARATIGGGALCSALPPVAAVAAAGVPPSPLARTLQPVVATTSLAAGAVKVAASASASAPLSVSARVPTGASTVAITVFRLNSPIKRASHARQASSSVQIATVYRTTTKAKRYVFRLTEKPFRHLRAGRYLVSVRVGPSRTVLGPAANRQITIKRSRTRIAR